ncbi:MAG: alpha/beta hydrolase [Eubacteriales bacterium]|nr:alpha/beta hydrolase [Eubacteriales bacterium]
MEHYIFELNENADRTHVRYKNRYGITLAGDLYTAKNIDKNAKNPALVVGPPYGGVKEQGPGVYANQLAQRGFVVLAFDPAFMGESEGEPRHTSSPDIFAENFSAGVDFLGTLSYVDRERIGVLGICGSGGFSLSAAAVDMRIKAVCTASMFDMTAFGNGVDAETWHKTMSDLSARRWADVDAGTPEVIHTYAEEPVDGIPDGVTGIWAEFYEFYGTKRGHHPRARAGFTTVSTAALWNFQSLNHIDMISPRPILFIVGENAESRGFSDAAFAAAGEAKEMVIIPNCNHVDLYDDVTKIPFDKIETFFKENLK